MRPFASIRLRAALLPVVLSLVVACGGTLSVLHARGKSSGDGPARVVVKNSSGVVIERLYVAKTEGVDKEHAAGTQPGSERGEDDTDPRERVPVGPGRGPGRETGHDEVAPEPQPREEKHEANHQPGRAPAIGFLLLEERE